MNQGALCSTFQKFFEIKVDHNAVARGNIALRLGHRLMGRAPRSEAVTMPGKRWVPLLLQNLQQGLLDQSVDDTRHAELSDPAIQLGDFDPFDRLRMIGSFEQLRPNAWPVLTQVVPGVADGHPNLSGRRRRARLLSRWPPSAAQTGRAVFPHPAFTKTQLAERQWKGSSRLGSQARTHRRAYCVATFSNRSSATCGTDATRSAAPAIRRAGGRAF